MPESTYQKNDSSSDIWGIGAKTYAAKMEHVTSAAAKELVLWVDTESSFSKPGAAASDNGCGTGMVAETLGKTFPTLPILAADLSPGMLNVVEEKNLSDV